MGVPDPEAKGADAPTASDTAPGILLDNNAVEAEYGSTKRGLSPRHVQLIAIGGAIGTGLFVGIGGTLAKAGPLSLILGYLSWGVFFVWPTNLCVAEMCSYLPISGGIFELAARYVDPALGFAMGWTYFYTGVMLLCVEYSAIATLMQYWVDDVNPAVWIVMGMVVCISLNVVAVKWYGESEFIMASLKILLLIGLLMLTLITMCGGNPKKDAYGFRYWGNHKAMLSFYTDGATGRLLGWWKVVIYAAFTITGPDILALSAGEIQNPRRTIPRVAKLVFYRLVGFYVLGVLGVGIICSGQDPTLKDALENGAPGAAASPWVIGIQNLGISGLPHLINFLILTSGMSCGNAYLYASSRTLYGLARDGQAPRFLMRCTKAGVPIYCVGIISVLSCITFLVSSTSALKVFYWFVDLTTTGFIATYTMMLWTFVGWYRARVKQGLNVASLHYTAPFAPYSAYLAIVLGILAIIFCGFDTIHPFKVQGFITNYFCIPYSIGFFFLWKIVKRTKFVDPETADIISGKKEVDEECREWEEGGIEENWRAKLAEMPFWQRVWERMW